MYKIHIIIFNILSVCNKAVKVVFSRSLVHLFSYAYKETAAEADSSMHTKLHNILWNSVNGHSETPNYTDRNCYITLKIKSM